MKIKCSCVWGKKKITCEQSPANYLSLLHFAGSFVKLIIVKKVLLLDMDWYWVFLRQVPTNFNSLM